MASPSNTVILVLEHAVEPLGDRADVLAHGAPCAAADDLARLHRLVRPYAGEDILFEQGGEALVHEQIELIQRLVVVDAVAHDARRNGVRVAERHAFLHEVVGNVRRGGKSARRGGAHLARVERNVLQQFVEDGQAAEHRLFGVEQRLLVLLQILV